MGEVTVMVVLPLAPGANKSEELPNAALHPAGTLEARLNVEEEQNELSLLVTLTV